MLGVNEKLRRYATTLERAYSSLIWCYIWDTFTPCINDPRKILKWRITTTKALFATAYNARRATSPQQEISDFLGLLPEVFPEPTNGSFDVASPVMKDEDGNTVPTQIMKDLDRQLCNYLRNQLAVPDDDDTQISQFYEMPKEQKTAIQDELDRPLSDFYGRREK